MAVAVIPRFTAAILFNCIVSSSRLIRRTTWCASRLLPGHLLCTQTPRRRFRSTIDPVSWKQNLHRVEFPAVRRGLWVNLWLKTALQLADSGPLLQYELCGELQQIQNCCE
jgi:hypothetical protein